MSISASYLVVAVMLLRLLLKKAPKWVSVLLWGFVAVRLLCPISFESIFSVIPSAEVISPEIMLDPTPQIHTGIDALNNSINPIIYESFAPQELVSMNPLQFWIPMAALVWLAGIAGMLIYTAVSYFLLRRKIGTAVMLEKNIFQSENVASPFVLGIIKPKIYLPFRIEGQNLQYVIAHEQAHIRRKDHIWKPLGFLLLTLHWFNPLMWLGYILLCRDIELACDEKVIKEMDAGTKADYTQALVDCSVSRRSIAACPLAFGEVGVKARVRSVLHYKKPAFWIILISIIICVAVAVCFLTNPMDRIGLRELNYDEVNMPGLLDDVTEMTLIYNGASVNCNQDDITKILSVLDTVQVSKEPISLNRSEDRSRDFVIKIGNTQINFNGGFTEFWEDDNVKPSLSHRILNSMAAKALMQEYERISLSQNTTEELTDLQPENLLQEAISGAILEKNAGDRFPDTPSGAIHTCSFRIFAMESLSGTPLIHQDNHMTQATVFIHYLYARYYYSGGQLQEQGSVCTPAVIRFSIDPEDGYTVEEFWEPNPGETYEKEVREKFPENAAKEILDRFKQGALSRVMQSECYAQATEHLAQNGADTESYRPYIDRIDYDIDGDGQKEIYTLTYGPTSGLFSITLYAETAGSLIKCVDTYVLENSYDLSFIAEGNRLRLKGENPQATPQTVYLDVSFADGHIRLFCEDETVLWSFWEP